MAQFCIVAPDHLCLALKKTGKLGNAHLLLAHEVVKHRVAYNQLFHPEVMRSYQRIVILDNSVIELGGAVDIDMVEDAAAAVQPTCVVLPDVLEDGRATISAVLGAYSIWYKRLVNNQTKLMVVPQGKTMEEFIECAEVFIPQGFPSIEWWGVPRNLVKNVGTRRLAIMILHAIAPLRKIHLLGFSDDLVDDVLCARIPIVTSIDSAVPLRVQFPLTLTSGHIPRETLWFETAEYHGYVDWNLDYIRHLVRHYDQ